MPAPKPPARTPAPESRYPAVERFIERSTARDVARLFEPIRASLETLKGPREVQAKKVAVALDRSQELLTLLLEARQRLFLSSRTTSR